MNSAGGQGPESVLRRHDVRKSMKMITRRNTLKKQSANLFKGGKLSTEHSRDSNNAQEILGVTGNSSRAAFSFSLLLKDNEMF